MEKKGNSKEDHGKPKSKPLQALKNRSGNAKKNNQPSSLDGIFLSQYHAFMDVLCQGDSVHEGAQWK